MARIGHVAPVQRARSSHWAFRVSTVSPCSFHFDPGLSERAPRVALKAVSREAERPCRAGTCLSIIILSLSALYAQHPSD